MSDFPEDKTRDLCRELGIPWHERKSDNPYSSDYNFCKECGQYVSNPDFSAPDGIWLLLGKMVERDGWLKFQSSLFDPSDRVHDAVIPIKYILTPGLLAEAAWGWLKGRKEA